MSEKETAHVIFITDRKDDYEKLSAMLKDFEFDIEIYVCASVKDLKSYHADKGCELLVYWHKTAAVEEKEIVTFMKAVSADPPGLVLVAAGISPADYVQVAALQAADIVNSEVPAQFPFVIKREIKNVRTKRKLRKVVRKLEDETVADITEYELSEEGEDLAPMVSTIDQALKSNRLELLFQPILAVQPDGYDNYEIFLRIRNNDDYVMPKNFLPVAEQYGLMPAIDRWVVKNSIVRFKAEQQVRQIKKQGRPLRFFVNISGHSLVDEVIMGGIITEIVSAKLDPGGFVLEVNKNTILSRLQKVKSLNQNIKKLKLQFAIDHYEESDIALDYLRHIDLDYIKLNKEIMDGVQGDKQKREAIREIVKKARSSNIKVIASQVEDAAVLPLLYEVGVDYIQGYLIAEPGTRLERAVIDASLDEAASS
jgi:EAL domain-containing protein (putative c-di-GMP-specific phosphodiesterase class I)